MERYAVIVGVVNGLAEGDELAVMTYGSSGDDFLSVTPAEGAGVIRRGGGSHTPDPGQPY